MTRRRVVVAVLAASAAGAILDLRAAAAQRYTPGASPIAPVAMSASCQPEAAAAVDLGAAWLLVEAPAEARVAFGRAVDADPDCALGYWGEALARFDDAAQGLAVVGAIEASIGRALAVPARTPFERAAVGALRALRDRVAAPGVPAAWPARFTAYRDALCATAASDRLARLWCARALADAAAADGVSTTARDALAHVVTLTRERAPDAGEAVVVLQVAPDPQAPIVARALAAIAGANPPAARPHLLAARMDRRRGDWTAAAASSGRAATVSTDADVRREAIEGRLEALLQLGQRREAYALAGTAMRLPADAGELERDLAARVFARVVLADRRLDGRGLGDRAALSIDPREAARWPAVFVAALDAALRAWPGGDATHLARARADLKTLETLTSQDGLVEVDWAITIVEAAIAASQDEHQQMALFLTHAAELERNPGLIWGGERLVPTAEIAAELWLRTYRYDDARREARAVLAEHPQRVSPYVVLARAGARVSDRAAALDAWRRVLDLRGTADADDTLRAEARQAVPP